MILINYYWNFCCSDGNIDSGYIYEKSLYLLEIINQTLYFSKLYLIWPLLTSSLPCLLLLKVHFFLSFKYPKFILILGPSACCSIWNPLSLQIFSIHSLSIIRSHFKCHPRRAGCDNHLILFYFYQNPYYLTFSYIYLFVDSFHPLEYKLHGAGSKILTILFTSKFPEL